MASFNRLTLGQPIGPGHETILNTLNKWKNYPSGPAYLAVENFIGTEPEWDRVPLIFAQEHPDLDLVASDLPAALASVTDYKGRPGSIPGFVSNTKVETAGQPRISLTTTFTDPEVQALYDAGLLSLSHGMYADNDEADHLIGKVRPNHVLVFVQDQQNQPVDQGAMFLSKQPEGGDPVKQFTGIGKVITDKRRDLFKTALDVLTALAGDFGIVSEREVSAKDGSPSVPPNPSGYGKSESPWSKPAEKDFGEMPLTEIRKCFAFDDGSGNFTGLKLGHHNPNGDVVKAGVDNAMARLSQTQDLGGLEDRVRSHLEAHQSKDFGEQKTPKGAKQEDDPMDLEIKKQLEAAEADKSRLAKELKDAQDAITQMKAKADEDAKTALAAKQDQDWALVKATLDTGLIHKAEDEARLKTEFITNPAVFTAKYFAKKPADAKGESGQEYSAKDLKAKAGDDKKEDPLAISRELRLSTGRGL